MTDKNHNFEAASEYDPMAGMLDYPEEMDAIKELDSDNLQTLYSVYIANLDLSISVLVNNDDGEEYYTTDWQSTQPKTMAECADYEWRTSDELFY